MAYICSPAHTYELWKKQSRLERAKKQKLICSLKTGGSVEIFYISCIHVKTDNIGCDAVYERPQHNVLVYISSFVVELHTDEL